MSGVFLYLKSHKIVKISNEINSKCSRFQVMGVLLVILSSVDSGGDVEEHKTQRHFNRAMAMRSLRGVALPGSRGRKKGGS